MALQSCAALRQVGGGGGQPATLPAAGGMSASVLEGTGGLGHSPQEPKGRGGSLTGQLLGAWSHAGVCLPAQSFVGCIILVIC